MLTTIQRRLSEWWPLECVSDEERALFSEVEHRLALQRSLAVRLTRAA